MGYVSDGISVNLLGDGYIHPRGQIQIHHTIKQLPYLNWKYEELKSLAYGPPTRVERFDPRYQKIYRGSRFWLRQYFRPLRKIFYPSGVKIFPEEIIKYFNDLALAVWYMDDGNLYRKRHLKIATDSFNNESRKRLQNFLKKKFELSTTLQKSGKLRVSSKSLNNFFKIVKPHIHSSMRYKTP